MKQTLALLSAAAVLALGAAAAMARGHARVAHADRDRAVNLIRAGGLIGSEAEAPDGTDLGAVRDIILDNNGQAAFVVVRAGERDGGREYDFPWSAVDVRCGDRERGEPTGSDQVCRFVVNEPVQQYSDTEGFRGEEWHGGRSATWSVREWSGMSARTVDGRDLGRIDDLVIDPDNGAVAFVLIDLRRDFWNRDVKTVAVPPDRIQATNDGLVVDENEQQLAQMAITDDRDMSQLADRARGLRYGHAYQQRHVHDRGDDRARRGNGQVD